MTARSWMDEGTRLFLDTLATISDDRLSAPTALEGWTGRHLVAHVHYNALALCRLASWASTGGESRMYSSPEQRVDEIEVGAQLPGEQLRDLVIRSAAHLAAVLDELTPAAWEHEVVTAQGRTVAATEIPWMRTREVYVHAIDLGGGASFADVPADVVTALLRDVVTKRVTAGEGPALAGWLTGRDASAPALGRWL